MVPSDQLGVDFAFFVCLLYAIFRATEHATLLLEELAALFRILGAAVFLLIGCSKPSSGRSGAVQEDLRTSGAQAAQNGLIENYAYVPACAIGVDKSGNPDWFPLTRFKKASHFASVRAWIAKSRPPDNPVR